MDTVKQGEELRWLTLIIVLANTVFNYYTKVWPTGDPVLDTTAYYHTLLIPSNYAFGIWGVVYCLFIIFTIYQLLPAQLEKRQFTDISVLLIFTNVLSSIWIIAVSNKYITLSMLIIIIMLVLSFQLLQQIKQVRSRYIYNSWLTVPFSLFFGWLSVIALLNADIWLASMGWHGEIMSKVSWTILLIVIMSLAGIFICFRYKDKVYPLVISWALIAIWIASYKYTEIAFVALISGVVVFLCTAAISISSILAAKHHHHSYTGRAVMKIIR
jgi:hypothetical protein